MLNITRKMAYVILGVAIVFEISADAALEACQGYKYVGMSILELVLIGTSFFLFSKVLHKIALSVAYATWSAVGTLACAVIGVICFGQNLSAVGWISIILLTAGTFILNMWGEGKKEVEE